MKPGSPGQRRPDRDRARDAGVEEADVREVAVQALDLDQERAGLAVERVGGVVLILTLTSAHSPSRRSPTVVGARLRAAEEHAVIARPAVVAWSRRCRR